MSCRRLARFALGCLLIASCCWRGGTGSNVEVFTPELVEEAIGTVAVIPCEVKLPEDGNYAYVNWYTMDRNTRKKIIYMIQGKQHHAEPEFQDRLSMSANFSLVISKVTLKDAKVYVCQVGLGSLGVGENRTELRVYKIPESPEILESDGGITASDSKMHTIGRCVSRNGYPTPTITWYKNKEPLSADGTEIEIRPAVTMESSGLITLSSTLSARVTKEDRHANFTCQVSHEKGKALPQSKSFKINVHYPSENISFQIEAQSPVKEGDNVTLRCKADGNPEPEYTFHKVEDKEVELPSTVGGGELVFHSVERSASGLYRCKALDLQNFMELTADLNLPVHYLDVPTIIPEQPKHLREGDNLHLACSTTSSGPVEIHWERNGNEITKGHFLNLTSMRFEMSGNYSCVARMLQAPSLVRSKQVLLAVHAKPLLASPKELVLVQKGKMAKLTCTVLSVPKPKITWSISNGTILSSRINFQYNSTLTVQVTEELLDSGINCSAENRLGRVEHHFRLEQIPEKKAPDSSKGNDTSREAEEPGSIPKKEPTKQESRGIIIVAVIVCILVLSILGAVLYFLHKKGRLPCGRSGKQEITRPEAHKDEIVVEVKSDKLPEEAMLLQGASGEKRSAGDQGEKYIDLRN
ncbi:cell surface glycoprotein MUC18 isoform X1 [Varanus komodoensis]|uniref:Melanoma cell adhesion molecule n=1 Tax=Varanus komodoensis TaxID=61221 RepID=A0A8D2J9N1_VARKO|nr:cell surface glycoprotein MUC18 isoform X1 [Varanus komodoensis]